MENVSQQSQIEKKCKEIDKILKSLSVKNEENETSPELIIDVSDLEALELQEWKNYLNHFKIADKETKQDIQDVNEVFKKASKEMIDLTGYLKDTLRLKNKINEKKNTKSKKMLLKNINERANDLNEKIMELEKKTPCEKWDNSFSILQQMKQFINGKIKIIKEEIATRVTENQMKFASNNYITPDEICEDFKSGDYKVRKVIFVNYGYRNSVEEDKRLIGHKCLRVIQFLSATVFLKILLKITQIQPTRKM
ncbi:unnamed protein product [Meganyctiphanes norvegica]|uniref:Uncharacterized protein n=1 Tax=Meganyctiphanes norvegica TaxID=48144 RepID=A0AAV2SJZ1_MEGNR